MCADGTTTRIGVCQNPECIETAKLHVGKRRYLGTVPG